MKVETGMGAARALYVTDVLNPHGGAAASVLRVWWIAKHRLAKQEATCCLVLFLDGTSISEAVHNVRGAFFFFFFFFFSFLFLV